MISFLVFKHVQRADEPRWARGEHRLVSTFHFSILRLRNLSALAPDIGSVTSRGRRHVA
jgi:hypothetical protein